MCSSDLSQVATLGSWAHATLPGWMPFPTPMGVFGGSAGVLNGGSSVVGLFGNRATTPVIGSTFACRKKGQAGQAAASAAIPAFSALRRVSLEFVHPSAFILRTCQSSCDPVHASVQQCASREKPLEAPLLQEALVTQRRGRSRPAVGRPNRDAASLSGFEAHFNLGFHFDGVAALDQGLITKL